MMAWIDNDPALERALNEAAAALLCCLADSTEASEKILRRRLIAVLRLRDGMVGKYVKVRVLREVLKAVLERSLRTFADEFAFRVRGRISSRRAKTVQHDLAVIFRKVCAIIDESMPIMH